MITTCSRPGFLRSLFFDFEEGGNMFSSKRRLTFNELHGDISPKTALSITTAARVSNPV
jgi:hypothetical protein